MTPRTLGVYGPFGSDRSGVARYIEDSLRHLKNHFDVTVVSNATPWIDPHRFDTVLYHLGNNAMHHAAFKAARARPGVALIHEYKHLGYYYQAADLVPGDVQADLLKRLASAAGIQASTFGDFLSQCDPSRTPDPYTLDVGVERYVVESSRINLVHSCGVARLLKQRYPDAAVEAIPFPVEPWPANLDRDLSRHGIAAGDFVFGTFGFISGYKQVPSIIEAWRRWRARPTNARLLLVGERQTEIDADVDGVVAVGYTDDDEFMRLLHAVDCGIQLRALSLGETSGPTASLAAHGRPLIVSDIPEMTLTGCRSSRILTVRAGRETVPDLVAAMKAQYTGGTPAGATFDPRFSWNGWARSVLPALAACMDRPAHKP